MQPEFVYLEEHRRRWPTAVVAVLALSVLAAGALLRSRDEGLDLTPDGWADWVLALLALAAVPAWLVLGDGAWSDLPSGSGLAVGRDRLVVDEVTFGFDELAPATATVGAGGGDQDRGVVEVPLADGGSLTLRPRDPDALGRWLSGEYARWAAARRPAP